MDYVRSSAVERTPDKRLRTLWSRKAIPTIGSTIFSKAKHSEEWHHDIDATAGVLHPSDPKFPYNFLRPHTDNYVKKKGGTTQADTDTRLVSMIVSHEARDIAIAAVAHAVTGGSLRAVLPVDQNVMQGSYWGLKMWLQCLIAANNGNPASVTDFEATWARKLLPFATQGSLTTEWFLVGMCRALRESNISDMSALPEFAILMRRAIKDFSTQLEGFRLRSQWAAAYDAVLWMMELAKTSPAFTPPGLLQPEHILDTQFPTWRLWTYWTPQVARLESLAVSNHDRVAMVSDLVALEGPDTVSGVENTLREGLVARYKEVKDVVRWRGVVVHLPERTKKSLRSVLDRVARGLDIAITASGAGHQDLFNLFRQHTIARPITTHGLDVFEATCQIPYTPKNDIYNAVREIYDHDRLGGRNILALQHVFSTFGNVRSMALRELLLTDWLRAGIEKCIRDCREVVQIHINKTLPWTDLALEYHDFCTTMQESERYWPPELQSLNVHPGWPSRDQMKAVVEIYEAAQAHRSECVNTDSSTVSTKDKTATSTTLGEDADSQQPLAACVESFCVDRVLKGAAISLSSQRTMTAILQVWMSTSKPQIDVGRRQLAVLVTKSVGTDFILRYRCLNEIATGTQCVESGTFTKALVGVLSKSETEMSQAIIELTDLLAAKEITTLCWKDLVYMRLEKQCQPGVPKGKTVLEHSLQTMKTAQWLAFMDRLEALFADQPASNPIRRPTPSILVNELIDCKTLMSKYLPTVMRLEAVIGDTPGPVRYVLGSKSWVDNLAEILGYLRLVEGKPVEVLMQRLVAKLRVDKRTDQAVKEALLNLIRASSEVADACSKIWDAKHGLICISDLPVPRQPIDDGPADVANSTGLRGANPAVVSSVLTNTPPLQRHVPPSVVEVMVAGWLQRVDIGYKNRKAIRSVADLLGIDTKARSSGAWTDKLREATAFWEGIANEIVEEANRLEILQRALRAKDPKGTVLLLQELGMPYNSFLDEEIMNLPLELMDSVERVADDGVEINFPLTAFTELQRSAMGIPRTSYSLILRLTQYDSEVASPSFCIHFNNDADLDTLMHSPWRCTPGSRPPHELVCSTPQTALVWQLSRILHTRLKAANIGISDLHRLVVQKLAQLGHLCITCETSHAALKTHLRRSTPCDLLACARLWYALPLDVRIPEIRTDTYAVDAMLTGVYAAAQSGRPELLPACPIRSTVAITTILNALPSVTVLSHAVNLSAVLRSHHADAEKLVSWACVQHRGYIASATGLCKVPNMPPGTHQFVLASARPGIEKGFASRLTQPGAQTTVLFHGTKMDRLPAILSQGLKVCSGTALQRTGAAHGKGIYMAEEPATSLMYAPTSMSWCKSGLGGMRVVLGCEARGPGRWVSAGIHVITEERDVVVRYVFFLTASAVVPIAGHVVPAMGSAMKALRMGAV
jgi:hypothetical protein